MLGRPSQTRGTLQQPLIQEEEGSDLEGNQRSSAVQGRVVRVESYAAPPPTSVYAHKLEDSQSMYAIDIDDADVKMKRRRRACAFVGVAAVLFLLLFFLIPRAPRMSYEVRYVYHNYIAST